MEEQNVSFLFSVLYNDLFDIGHVWNKFGHMIAHGFVYRFDGIRNGAFDEDFHGDSNMVNYLEDDSDCVIHEGFM